jgi:hypothetical protein
MYNPDLGTFNQRDPIGYKGGVDLYEYVGDNPVNRVDPKGLVSPPDNGVTRLPPVDGPAPITSDNPIIDGIGPLIIPLVPKPSGPPPDYTTPSGIPPVTITPGFHPSIGPGNVGGNLGFGRPCGAQANIGVVIYYPTNSILQDVLNRVPGDVLHCLKIDPCKIGTGDSGVSATVSGKF